jgi:hypothetical protein
MNLNVPHDNTYLYFAIGQVLMLCSRNYFVDVIHWSVGKRLKCETSDDIDRNSDNVCGVFSLNDSIKFNIKMCI